MHVLVTLFTITLIGSISKYMSRKYLIYLVLFTLLLALVGIGIMESSIRNTDVINIKMTQNNWGFNVLYKLSNGGTLPVTLSNLELNIYYKSPEDEQIFFCNNALEEAFYLKPGSSQQNHTFIWYQYERNLADHLDNLGMNETELDQYLANSFIRVEIKGRGNCLFWTRNVSIVEEIKYNDVLRIFLW
jgi:hypothetical protein